MKVILLENVIGLGYAGDIKNVRNGYARNYLIPNRFAEMATLKKEQEIKKMQESLAKKAKELLDSAKQVKDVIEKVQIVIRKKVGEEGKLFGSVTNADISDAIKEKGFDIDKRKVVVDHIKVTGEYPVKLKLDEGVLAEVKLFVIDENAADPTQKAAPAPEAAVVESAPEAEAVASETETDAVAEADTDTEVQE